MTKHPYYDEPIPNEGTLHRMDLERDACGVGFVAQVNGKRSHQILEYAIGGCCNVIHRGAMEADMKTGDGAGILIQLPDALFRTWAAGEGKELPAPGDYAVAMCFLPQDEPSRTFITEFFEKFIIYCKSDYRHF